MESLPLDELIKPETFNESQLVDRPVVLQTNPSNKVRPPFLMGDLEVFIEKYPTNGLSGLL